MHSHKRKKEQRDRYFSEINERSAIELHDTIWHEFFKTPATETVKFVKNVISEILS